MSNNKIHFSKDEDGFHLKTDIVIARPLAEVFDFFSSAENLEYLTPSSLNFHILTPRPIEMKAGLLIDYKLKLYGVGFKWKTEITEWEPLKSFVDEQRKGPYSYWIHRHSFEDMGEGTLVKDHVRYGLFGGSLVNKLFVQPELERIFAFRESQMLKYFN